MNGHVRDVLSPSTKIAPCSSKTSLSIYYIGVRARFVFYILNLLAYFSYLFNSRTTNMKCGNGLVTGFLIPDPF